ncbi:MAG: hypothetical protein ACKVQT_22160 [Burkholderiales bacterium]
MLGQTPYQFIKPGIGRDQGVPLFGHRSSGNPADPCQGEAVSYSTSHGKAPFTSLAL